MMAAPSSSDLFVKGEALFASEGGAGGGGGCRGVMAASDESLAVALAVAVAAAAVCYTLTAASAFRRLLEYRLVSTMFQFVQRMHVPPGTCENRSILQPRVSGLLFAGPTFTFFRSRYIKTAIQTCCSRAKQALRVTC